MTVNPVSEPLEVLQLRAVTGTRRDHLTYHRARVRDTAFRAHVEPAGPRFRGAAR
jgi:hypothetical protein